ncbi:m7GpppN-mRNA hydrolase [Trichonephila inaurata madagascariensis]|uniref:m7GpppN-mRNA hydrolase n=1 Tax=Trichonephila inaurata madagascariensis TaxID=2747483 RepID=A0A8X7CBN1_9ARAC|nr:m7GpppN-mRNA hydrolase [Trichonephila inaurata madagascariensis]
MFLVENRNLDVPVIDYRATVNLRKRVRYRQKLLNDLRHRFRKEYLGLLIQNKNKKGPLSELRLGEIVLIGDDIKKWMHWPLAKVIRLIPGKDGKIRTVELMTRTGTMLLSIQRVYPLEVHDMLSDSNDSSSILPRNLVVYIRKKKLTKELVFDSLNTMAESRKNPIPNDLLNDLSSRFIINVPEEERVDLIRLCFQIELAHWFYLDFYCEEDTKLPKIALKDFIRIIFGHIPFLQKYNSLEVDSIIIDWREYKKAVPTYGAILLDEELKNVLLVQSFVYKTSWGFPKGKVNKDELPHHCAIREVLEETGFDITDLLDKEAYLEHYFNDQLIRLYIITGIPVDAKFQPKTRNEIKGCEWFSVNQLVAARKDPTSKTTLCAKNFFMVMPFVKQLRKWISAKQSVANQEKILHSHEIDKHLLKQQQLLYAQMTKSDYARYVENTSPAESRNFRQQHKSNYSPPPRMLRQRNAKHGDSEKKKNSSLTDDKVMTHSKYTKKAPGESSKSEKNVGSSKNSFIVGEDGFYPISKTWINFSLDCEALVATFNINLRTFFPKRIIFF